MSEPLISKLLTPWADSTQSCSLCKISKLCNHKVTHRFYASRHNRPSTDLLLIGEAPGESEYINREPFLGPAGQQLDKILMAALSPQTSYVITNSVLCTPYSSEDRSHIRSPSISEIEACVQHLVRLAKRIKPKGYIALGAVAERAIKRLVVHYELPYAKILHPSKIAQSLKYHYEYDKAVLTIKNFESKVIYDQ